MHSWLRMMIFLADQGLLLIEILLKITYFFENGHYKWVFV